MKVEERRNLLAERLAQFVQIGFIKGRGKEKYTRFTAKYINCLADACLGLTNGQIKEYVSWQYVDKVHCPSPLGTFQEKDKNKLLEEMFKFLRKTGLSVSPYLEGMSLTQNQRRVAVYFSKAYDIVDADKRFLSKDFHYLYQQPNGIWTGKWGFGRTVKRYKNLPETIKMQKDNPYVLYGEFVITNPYATAYPVISNKEKTHV